MKKCLVLGAAGFLGSHLEHRLKAEGNYVVSVARHQPPYRKSVANELNILDLTNVAEFHHYYFRHAFDEVYQMAGEVGGIGYIADSANDSTILVNSLKINLHTLEAIQKAGNVGRVFFASSQCVYPRTIEIDPYSSERISEDEPGMYRECDARFENNFAFAREKLYAESLYQAFGRDHGLVVRIGRLGNTYGPYCAWNGNRAKAVAAICRKVAEAPYASAVELWGDGTQQRSFTYVEDAIEGILRLMRSDYSGPVNIAHSEMVTVQELFEVICEAAGKILAAKPGIGPIGAAVRGSHNGLCRQVLGWEPTTSLWLGLGGTYSWIKAQVENSIARSAI